MFKKEYFLVFALIGLSIVYAFLSIIVFFSRGKWGRAFSKKLTVGAMIIAFCGIINSQNVAFSQSEGTPSPTPVYGTLPPIETLEPTVSPDPIPPYSAPMIMVVPATRTVHTNENFTTDINVNSTGSKIAAYGITATYDSSLISVDVTKGSSGVAPGTDGFISAVNSLNPGEVVVAGFDVSGKGPGWNLNLLRFYWTAGATPGSTLINFTVDKILDQYSYPIGYFYGVNADVHIIELKLGDVNGDTEVDIIDALLVAQFYVDMNPENFIASVADVDASGTIDIIDALLIAQKFVGLIDIFPGE